MVNYFSFRGFLMVVNTKQKNKKVIYPQKNVVEVELVKNILVLAIEKLIDIVLRPYKGEQVIMSQ